MQAAVMHLSPESALVYGFQQANDAQRRGGWPSKGFQPPQHGLQQRVVVQVLAEAITYAEQPQLFTVIEYEDPGESCGDNSVAVIHDAGGKGEGRFITDDSVFNGAAHGCALRGKKERTVAPAYADF
jgi:hypothetical protein